MWCREVSLVVSNDQNYQKALNRQTNKTHLPTLPPNPTTLYPRQQGRESESREWETTCGLIRDHMTVALDLHNLNQKFLGKIIEFLSLGSLTCKMETVIIYLAPWGTARNKSGPHMVTHSQMCSTRAELEGGPTHLSFTHQISLWAGPFSRALVSEHVFAGFDLSSCELYSGGKKDKSPVWCLYWTFCWRMNLTSQTGYLCVSCSYVQDGGLGVTQISSMLGKYPCKTEDTCFLWQWSPIN